MWSIFFVHIAYCPHPCEISCSFIKYFLNFLNKCSLKNSELSLQRVSEEIDKLMVSIKDFTDSFLTDWNLHIKIPSTGTYICILKEKKGQFAVHLLIKCDSLIYSLSIFALCTGISYCHIRFVMLPCYKTWICVVKLNVTLFVFFETAW